MQCAVLFTVFYVLVSFLISHGQVEAQNSEVCNLWGSFPGSCGNDGNEQCKRDFSKGVKKPLFCTCTVWGPKRLCSCEKCFKTNICSPMNTKKKYIPWMLWK
nr:S-locus cysteine-rich protein haplogroup E [Arabidopsis kamchatica]